MFKSNKVLNADLTSTDSGAIYILGRSDAATGMLVRMNFIDGTGPANQPSTTSPQSRTSGSTPDRKWPKSS